MKVPRNPVFDAKGFYKALGEQVRKARIEQGLLQRQVGALIDMSRGSIGLLENGKNHISLHDAAILAKLLKFSLDDLLTEFKVSAPRQWMVQKLHKHEQEVIATASRR